MYVESVESVLSRPFKAQPLAMGSPRYYLADSDGEPLSGLMGRQEAAKLFQERRKLGTAEIGERIIPLHKNDPRVRLKAHGVND